MPGASHPDGAVTEPAEELPAEPASKLGRRTILIVTAIAVLALAAVGTTVYFLTRGDDKPAAAAGDQNAGQGAGNPSGGAGGGTKAAPPPPPPTGPAAAEVGSARQVAEQAVKAFNTHDAQAYKKISCDPEISGPADNAPPEARVELAANPELSGETGTVELKLVLGDQSTSLPLPLRKQNGTWCVD